MFSQEGIALRLEQTWALITQQVLQVGARGDQRGVDIISARGGGSHSPSLSPLASSQTSSLLTVFFFRFFFCFFVLVSFTVSPANLPVLLDCGIFSQPLPPFPQSSGRGGSKFPAGYQLSPSCGWVDIIFLFFQPSPLLGGQGCHG